MNSLRLRDVLMSKVKWNVVSCFCQQLKSILIWLHVLYLQKKIHWSFRQQIFCIPNTIAFLNSLFAPFLRLHICMCLLHTEVITTESVLEWEDQNRLFLPSVEINRKCLLFFWHPQRAQKILSSKVQHPSIIHCITPYKKKGNNKLTLFLHSPQVFHGFHRRCWWLRNRGFKGQNEGSKWFICCYLVKMHQFCIICLYKYLCTSYQSYLTRQCLTWCN